MAEDIIPIFTTEQVLDNAKANVTCAWLGTIAYLKEQRLSSHDWSIRMGKLFVPLWQELKGRGAREAARAHALGCTAFGATLVSFEGDESSARYVVAGWPNAFWLQFFQITQAEADISWEALGPVAASLDLQFHWQREDDCVRFTLSRES
jgi:hypothetical protein